MLAHTDFTMETPGNPWHRTDNIVFTIHTSIHDGVILQVLPIMWYERILISSDPAAEAATLPLCVLASRI